MLGRLVDMGANCIDGSVFVIETFIYITATSHFSWSKIIIMIH
jgi:hypothetical protein